MVVGDDSSWVWAKEEVPAGRWGETTLTLFPPADVVSTALVSGLFVW